LRFIYLTLPEATRREQRRMDALYSDPGEHECCEQAVGRILVLADDG
jgi:hypothetical protein